MVGGNGRMGHSGHHGGGHLSRSDRYASVNGGPAGRGPSSDFDSMYTYTPLPLASGNTPESPRKRGGHHNSTSNAVMYTQIPLSNMEGHSGGTGYHSIRTHLYENQGEKYHPKEVPAGVKKPQDKDDDNRITDYDVIPEEERAEAWKDVCHHFTQNTTFHGMNKITESTPFMLRRYVVERIHLSCRLGCMFQNT